DSTLDNLPSVKHGAFVLVYFLFRRHAIVSGSQPLSGVMSPRRSIALMELRLADGGRISSLSFNRRRIGLPPSKSVSSWIRFGGAKAGLVPSL
ncbi:MAG: hypothetical protein WA804_04740, partial [Terriglobales bacterium]